MSTFKDLFSKQSTDYAKFRPTYPRELYEYLATLTPSHELAWDCGTGNGQAAVELAQIFKRVVATDPSAKQIESATRKPNIEYEVGSAEKSNLKERSLDLITVAQAFHWFKHDQFFTEAKRVLKPRGILAVWTYALARITPEIDKTIMKLYEGILGPYWEPERKLVEDGYQSIRFPMKELTPPPFSMRAQWNFEHLIGYLGTWSSSNTYIKKHGTNPIEMIYDELRHAWGKTQTREVIWALGLRVAQND